MNRKHKRDDELRNRCLSIRWSGQHHRALTDTAWQKRTSISEYVRTIVLDHLQQHGVKIN